MQQKNESSLTQRILPLLKKYREQISYLFFGFLTVVVDQASFMILLRILPIMTSVVPTILSWIIAVNFAYFTNRKWVFQAKYTGIPALIREAISFYIARIFSLLLAVAIMWLFVDIMGLNADLIKLASTVLVVILNYVFSKFWIFKEKKP